MLLVAQKCKLDPSENMLTVMLLVAQKFKLDPSEKYANSNVTSSPEISIRPI